MKSRLLRVLLFKTDGIWNAQCLEHDIAAQARTLKGVRREMERLLVLRTFAGVNEGIEAFADVPQAPDAFWRRWETAPRLERDGRNAKIGNAQECPEPIYAVAA